MVDRCLLSLWVIAGFITCQAQVSQAGGSDWLAYGDLRGNLQSCGCDPRTDLGGVARLATMLSRERAEHPNALVLDLGNNFSLTTEPGLKDQYIEQALVAINADAALINRSELRYTGTPHRQKRSMVLSNLADPRSQEHQSMGQESIVKGHVLVLGYHWHESYEDRLLVWSNSTLKKRWQNLLRSHAGKRKVLLFAGPQAHLQAVAKEGLFDLIVSSNDSPDTKKPAFDEMEEPQRLARLIDPAFVRMVPLGGVGVLRGGKLRLREAASLAQILATKISPASLKTKSLTETDLRISVNHPGESLRNTPPLFDIPITWLTPLYQEASPLKELLHEYETAAAADFASRGAERRKDIESSPFAGAQACATCHPQAFNVWQASRHAQAHQPLVMVGKHQDGECVTCHVLGYEAKGGFVNADETPQFAGVQCENCHGPRREHAANPTVAVNKDLPKRICQQCHHPPHSSDFAYDQYWPNIRHGK